MTILVTAGTGKTAQKLIPYLTSTSTPFILTSRTPKPSPSSSSPRYITFDFTLPSTYPNAFPTDLTTPIKAIYLILPITDPNAEKVTIDFVEYAVREKKVKRFVILTGTTAKKGGVMVGKVWERIGELGAEVTVLRATWFTENFTEWFHHKSIKEEGVIYSAMEDGKVPYVTTDDISRLAFHALTSPTLLPEDLRVTGPKNYTLDEVAAIFTQVLGKPIKHVRQSEEERVKYLMENDGMDKETAGFMTFLDVRSAGGNEEGDDGEVERYTGKAPTGLEEWVERNKGAFL